MIKYHYDFNERAGILEYDAGLSREHAEQNAFAQVLKQYMADKGIEESGREEAIKNLRRLVKWGMK